ncbi:MAG: hypothetical protein JO000_09865 [Alphaproteobacteria bacterium]|nr:hypothetical protein [Alphaproteobacteria bacterium]
MFKSFIATLILASTVLGVASHANAGPQRGAGAPPTGEQQYFERASKNWDGGGY